MTLPLRVIKVGGSVLDRPTAMRELPGWIESTRSSHRLLLIIGGGASVDRVRDQTALGQLTEAEAHWEAIKQMDRNAAMVASLLGRPALDLTVSPPLERVAVGLVSHFLREVEPDLDGSRLPIGWEVTSDSIAARVAAVYDADLMLLKSCPPPSEPTDHAQLARQGYVDQFFPTASLGLREVLFQAF